MSKRTTTTYVRGPNPRPLKKANRNAQAVTTTVIKQPVYRGNMGFQNQNRFGRGRALPAFLSGAGGEIKAIDIPFVISPFRAPATATGIILLNGVQTGAGFFNRVGSRIEMKSLHVRGAVVNTATTAATGVARLLIVYDRQPGGALPVITDILLNRDQAGATSITGAAEVNLDNRDRWIILRDTEWYIPSCTNTAGVLTNGPQFPGDDDEFDVNLFIPLKGLITHFNSTANPATIANIATGALYAVFVTNATDSTWSIGANYRLRFDDK